MSKLYDIYLSLKSQEENSISTLYLFKSGIFFIFLDNDARIVSSLIGLKLTNLTEKIVKCGFPINSLEKYKNLLYQTSYTIKIIDTTKNISYTPDNFSIDNNIKKLLEDISKIEIDNLSISEAYNFIEKIQIKAKKMLN